MAKVPYSKLAVKVNTTIASFEENEQTIEVKQYLPIEEKMAIITNILNETVDMNGYYNAGLLDMNMTLEVVFAYTNISFTDKQKESREKLFDAIISSTLWQDICTCIPASELKWISRITAEQIDKIYAYRNSAMGIMEMVTKDYGDLKLDAQEIEDSLQNPSNLTLLKDVLTKLG